MFTIKAHALIRGLVAFALATSLGAYAQSAFKSNF